MRCIVVVLASCFSPLEAGHLIEGKNGSRLPTLPERGFSPLEAGHLIEGAQDFPEGYRKWCGRANKGRGEAYKRS
jgi:hypothetical protein